MRIALFGWNFSPIFKESMQRLLELLHLHKTEVILYKPFLEFLRQEAGLDVANFPTFSNHQELKEVDFFLSIGGDGTFLEAITFVRDSGIPMVGINSGRLGFLADIAQAELEASMEQLFSGRFILQPRSLIQLENDNGLFSNFPYALNEFTVHKQDSSQMITVHVLVGGDLLNSYWSDGLIVSTPTGSTAYSLSVGGPILTPEAANFIIAPIAPHNLAIRPVVLPDHEEVTLKVEGRGARYMASLDSRSEPFDENVVWKIRKSPFSINVLKFENQSFYETLRKKLLWGADKRN
ncbi:MAG: NAD kinase [Marinilabiliales bacterium]|nr:NAD kinase [Marinilabiliales bacterium]